MSFRLYALTVLSVSAISCGGDDSSTGPQVPTPVATTLSLSSSTLSFSSLGASQQLTATVKDQNAATMAGAAVTWVSSDQAVATVSSTGLVTSVGNGSTAVTVTSGAASGSASVAVEQVAVALRVATQPDGASAGEPISTQPVVEVRDANHHKVSGKTGPTITAALQAGPAELFGALAVQTIDGEAAFSDLAVHGLVGQYEIVFRADGLTSSTSTPFAVTAGAATALGKVTGEGSEVIAGAVVTVSVRVVDAFGNGVSEARVIWSIGNGGGSVEQTESISDSQGLASAEWTTGPSVGTENRLVATSSDGLHSVTYVRTPVAPTAPVSFAEDAVIVSPGRNAQIRVVDAAGLQVPGTYLSFLVDHYTGGDPGGSIEVSGDGTVAWAALVNRSFGFRVRADFLGSRVDGLVLVFVYQEHQDRVLLATEHWRLALPSEWFDRISATVPDFGDAIDVGWEAQHELFGMTQQEWHTSGNPSDSFGPFSSGMNDRDYCGSSSNPMRFGPDCFVFPENGQHSNEPRWFVIFHEMGHQSNSGHSLFSAAQCCGGTYIEGDATIAGMWSGHRMMESPNLSPQALASVRAQFDQDSTYWGRRLREWEAGSEPFSDDNSTFDANMWDGVHAGLIREFGWDYLKRYVRAWRNDPNVRAILGIDVCCQGNTTLTRRATSAVAAVSAALRTDLRDRFVQRWRFPIDDDLFQTLYDYWLQAMDEPLPGQGPAE